MTSSLSSQIHACLEELALPFKNVTPLAAETYPTNTQSPSSTHVSTVAQKEILKNNDEDLRGPSDKKRHEELLADLKNQIARSNGMPTAKPEASDARIQKVFWSKGEYYHVTYDPNQKDPIISFKGLRITCSPAPTSAKKITSCNLLEKLLSGKRKGKEGVKPALPKLLEKAQAVGKATLLVLLDSTMHRVKITREDTSSFTLSSTTSFKFAKEEKKALDGIGVREKPLLDLSVNALQQLIKNLLYERTFPDGAKEGSVHIPGMTLPGRPPNPCIQLHLKDDDTITLGVAKFIAKGTSLEVWHKVRLGLEPKEYAFGRVRDQSSTATIKNEALMLQRFSHPYILGFKSFKENDPLGAVLKTVYCDRGNLTTFGIRAPKNKAEQLERFTYVYQTAQALAYLHKNGYAHMDVKPHNIFLSTEEKKAVAKLGDLDLKKDGEQSYTTAPYTDPDAAADLALGNTTLAHRSIDVWSLGITLFEFMYGVLENPFYNPQIGLPQWVQAAQGWFSPALIRKRHSLLIGKLNNKLIDPAINRLITQMLDTNRESRVKLDDPFLQNMALILDRLQTKKNGRGSIVSPALA